MKINEIDNESCLDGLPKLKSECVDLCVTSPPYDDLRSYNDSALWSLDIFKEIAIELYRVLKPGAILVWVVGDAVYKGSETGTSFKHALYFMDLGFKLHDTMIYQKNSSSFPAKHNGNRYSQIFEYMFVFSKNRKPKTANLIIDKPNNWAGWTPWGNAPYRAKDGSFVARTQIKPVPKFSPRNNIWKYNTGKNFTTKDTYAFGHPAMFPELLAKDHILSWSNEGDLVLDPFIGSGTTAAMCVETDRNYIGFEIDSTYYNICKQRILDHTINRLF